MDLSKYKAVVFDLFHTLTSVEWAKAPGQSTSSILGVSSKDWTDQLVHHSPARLKGMVRDPVAIISTLAHAIDPHVSQKKIKEAAKNRLERFRFSMEHIDASTLGVLVNLVGMGKKLAVASNADVNEIHHWDRSPLAKYFDTVIFSCFVGSVKPEPAIFRMAHMSLGLSPLECVYVGDGGSDEMRAAKELGFTTVLTTRVVRDIWPDQVEKAQKHADFVIHELDELLN